MNSEYLNGKLDTIIENTLRSIRNSVVYHESKNKEEFLKGAQIAFEWSKEALIKEYGCMARQRDTATERTTELLSDFETLATIIQKYTPYNDGLLK